MPALVELLRPPRRTGFPAAYLQARLAGRRGRWLESCPPGSGEEARRHLDRELDWLYNQLETELRRQLAPVLLCFELPTLLAALRCMEAGDQRGCLACLERSRLSREIRRILSRERPYPATLQELGERLAPWAERLAGLATIRRQYGRAGLEQTLGDGLLAAAKREQPNGPLGDFLDQLAARRQLLRQAKAAHWPGKIAAAKPPRRQRIQAERQTTGETEPDALDHQLLRGMARDWRRRRTGSLMEQLLDYLWTIHLAARDCGLRHLTDLLGAERVARETSLSG